MTTDNMSITEMHGPFGAYICIKGQGYDLSVRMEKPAAVESLMDSAAEMRRKQCRLQGLAEMLERAAAQLTERSAK